MSDRLRWLTSTCAVLLMLGASGACFGLTPPADQPGPAASPGPASATLNVPSPDWRDQIIYFLMTDRFDDGDPRNNDQHAGEYDPADGAKYNGGDLRGVERRLDYIRGLGATAVWITPPTASQWWNPAVRYGGYHGYWPVNFLTVDAHVGTLADYQQLSRAIHGAGMYLVQDIVLNHTGDYFGYGDWHADDPSAGFEIHPDSRGQSAPSQWPFKLNDARIRSQRDAGIYHWTPNISDYKDPHQVSDFQMAGLDDLNSENPLVRATLRKSYGYWIREAGVDAFRIDTAFYVPPEALADFLYSDDRDNPGILHVAKSTGRTQFHVFGEGFATDKPYDDAQAKRIDNWMRRADGSPLLPGMLNFPLYASIGDVFARGHPTAEMAYRIDSMMRLYAHPELMPSFLDNHDVDRFLAGGDQAGLKQALLLMMTLPGIPTIYYGTEQAFTGQRAAMFKNGSGSGGVDHFDTSAPLYRYIQKVSALRREHRLFSRGRPTMLRSNESGPGILAYRMNDGDASALVVFNTSDHDALCDNLETGLGAGAVMERAFDVGDVGDDSALAFPSPNGRGAGERVRTRDLNRASTVPSPALPLAAVPRLRPSPGGRGEGDLITGDNGRVTMKLPPRSGQVWLVTDQITEPPTSSGSITLNDLAALVATGDFQVSGTATGARQVELISDGDLANAQTVSVRSDGHWQAQLDTSRMIDPNIEHTVVAWDVSTGAVSASRSFKVSRQWTALADIADPVGDDDGLTHRYRYPNDTSWGSHRQLDIQRIQIAGAGGALKVTLRMNEITTPWNPPNGFDHVAFTLFVQVPGKTGGASVMPLQNAQLPQGMQWNYRLRAHGWSNALFSAAGAAASNEGSAVAPAAGINVDPKNNTVTFTLSGSALGGIHTLSGVKLYVSTWDYDGGFRPLNPTPGAATFGGGDGATDPLIMDDSAVIILP